MSSRKLCQVYRCICILFFLVVLTAIYIISFQRSQKIERQTHLELMSDMVVRQTEHSKIAQNQGPTTWDIISSSCRANLNIVRSWGFSRLDSKFQQFLIYRHCRYFPILMNHPEKCAGIVDLLMVIKSVITHYDRREVIRQTWGNEQTMGGKTIKILFLLGTSSNEEVKAHYQKLLEYENHIYQDILQWDFMDSFFNLTLKEIHFLKWFNIYCGNTRYIFKGDDDVFVNVPNILEYLEASKDLKDLFVGDVLFKAGPIRIKTSKYYMPRSLYKQRQYPPYACGGGFLMDGALARKLNGACQTLELYPIDDVFLGMCLKVLQVTPIKHDAFKTFGIIGNETSKLNWEPCFFRDIIVVHKLLPPDLINMWRRINSDLDCWQKMENVQSETLI